MSTILKNKVYLHLDSYCPPQPRPNIFTHHSRYMEAHGILKCSQLQLFFLSVQPLRHKTHKILYVCANQINYITSSPVLKQRSFFPVLPLFLSVFLHRHKAMGCFLKNNKDSCIFSQFGSFLYILFSPLLWKEFNLQNEEYHNSLTSWSPKLSPRHSVERMTLYSQQVFRRLEVIYRSLSVWLDDIML